jgi:hypothetical protein
MSEMVIDYVKGEYTLRNDRGEHVLTLSVGQRFELKLHGQWCQVRLESGGYRGCYYIMAAGERGRLALCMQARMCQQIRQVQQAHKVSVEDIEGMAAMSLEQARAAWVGKEAESRVPLVCGMVRGVVRDITQRGQVVFVYTPRLNGVPVEVLFPFERIGEVLAAIHVAA